MDHEAIIAALGGADVISAEIGVPYDTVRKWQERGRIPPRHWPSVVTLAASRRVRGITCDLLAAGWIAASPGRAA
jgi:hypothetical protein